VSPSPGGSNLFYHHWIFDMQHFTSERDDRASLKALLTALDASETALRRDPPIRGQENVGDWAIWGKDDDLPIGTSSHIYADGNGYLIYFTVPEEMTEGPDGERTDREPSSRPWKNAKARLSFCQVTQDGDWEGCLRLDRLPAPHEGKAIREVLGIRKRRSGTADPTPLLRDRR
jgi:hypothetical protein